MVVVQFTADGNTQESAIKRNYGRCCEVNLSIRSKLNDEIELQNNTVRFAVSKRSFGEADSIWSVSPPQIIAERLWLGGPEERGKKRAKNSEEENSIGLVVMIMKMCSK